VGARPSPAFGAMLELLRRRDASFEPGARSLLVVPDELCDCVEAISLDDGFLLLQAGDGQSQHVPVTKWQDGGVKSAYQPEPLNSAFYSETAIEGNYAGLTRRNLHCDEILDLAQHGDDDAYTIVGRCGQGLVMLTANAMARGVDRVCLGGRLVDRLNEVMIERHSKGLVAYMREVVCNLLSDDPFDARGATLELASAEELAVAATRLLKMQRIGGGPREMYKISRSAFVLAD
jgi:hypothetical protein